MSDVLQLKIETAQKLYNEGTQAEKDLLVKMYGKAPFGPVLGRRETFADLCQEAGKNVQDYAIPENGTAKEKSDAYYAMLELVEEVLNEGWVANIADVSQDKYYVWANIIPDSSRPFGFRLSCGDYAYDGSGSALGARPYFKDSKTAIKAFKTFTDIYEGWVYYLNLSKQKTN